MTEGLVEMKPTTKRQAILLLLSGVISKMANADEKGNVPGFPAIKSSPGSSFIFTLDPKPMGITLNLNSFTGITVMMNGETLTITSAELFEALKG